MKKSVADIRTGQVDDVNISGNTVEILSNNTGIFTFGMEVQQCPKILVKGNAVTSFLTSELLDVISRGLQISNSSAIDAGGVLGNTFNSVDIGVHLAGTCGLVNKFRDNIFNAGFFNMEYGLFVENAASMGNQNCGSNQWNGLFNVSGYRCDGPVSLNTFFVQGFTPPFFPPNPQPPNAVQGGTSCLTDGGGGINLLFDDGGSDLGSISDKFKLYPNPTSEYVEIQLPTVDEDGFTLTQVRDMAGKLVLHTHESGTGSISLDVSKLPPGIYSVCAKTGFSDFFEKLVIVR